MPFESYAIVEIMGHVRIAGKVTEQTIAGAAMLRVDVPKTSKKEAFTKFYGAGSIYSITPTDEETANRAAEYFDETPVQPYILRLPESTALAEKVVQDDDTDFENTAYEDSEWEDDDYPDDDDDYYYEEYPASWYDAKSDLDQLEDDDTPRTINIVEQAAGEAPVAVVHLDVPPDQLDPKTATALGNMITAALDQAERGEIPDTD